MRPASLQRLPRPGLEELGISFAHYRVLELLDGAPARHIAGIARCFRVTRQATHATVGKLLFAGPSNSSASRTSP